MSNKSKQKNIGPDHKFILRYKLDQLSAMMTVLDAMGEDFSLHEEDVKAEYIGAMADLVGQCKEAAWSI